MRCEGALARLESSRAIPFLEKIFCTDSSGVTNRHNRALSYIERPPMLGRCISTQSTHVGDPRVSTRSTLSTWSTSSPRSTQFTARASFFRRLLLIPSGRRRNRLPCWSDNGYNRRVLGEWRRSGNAALTRGIGVGCRRPRARPSANCRGRMMQQLCLDGDAADGMSILITVVELPGELATRVIARDALTWRNIIWLFA